MMFFRKEGLIMFLLLYLAWIIFNGNITLEIAIIGLLVVALVFAFMCKFMGYSIKKELKLYSSSLYLLAYAFVLIKEIIKANLVVIHMITTRREVMEPVIVKFKTNIKSELLKVILANSITLTPGTITVSLEKDEYVVHCLDVSLSEGMEDSIFVKMLEKMDKRG